MKGAETNVARDDARVRRTAPRAAVPGRDIRCASL